MKKEHYQPVAGNIVFPLTTAVFSIAPIMDRSDGTAAVLVKSSLSPRETFDVVWARVMGLWLIDDMYVEEDHDDGSVIYRFEMIKP